jgi:hypothetical protein
MKVKAITKFIYKGKEYNSLKEIKEDIHNTIGTEVIDKITKTVGIRHKDLFKLLDILCEPEIRKVLTECLNVEFEDYNEFSDTSETINVLDLK